MSYKNTTKMTGERMDHKTIKLISERLAKSSPIELVQKYNNNIVSKLSTLKKQTTDVSKSCETQIESHSF